MRVLLAAGRHAGLLPILLLSACSPAPTAPTAAGDGHAGDADHHDTVQLTLWSESHELFVEHEPPAAGTPLEFVTHVSGLPSGAPRIAGPITYRLRGPDGAELETVDPAPARPGIYLTELTFPTSGGWTVAIEVPLPTSPGESSGAAPRSLDALELPSIHVRAAGTAPPHVHASGPEGIAFLKEQQWRLGTRIEPVAAHPLVHRVRAPGSVRPVPARTARVSSGVAGRIEPAGDRSEGGLPDIGTVVEAGALLGAVVPPFSEQTVRLQEAAADAIRAELSVERAELVLARTRTLYEQGARSQRELEEDEFALRLARADRAAALAVTKALESAGVAFVAGEGEDAGVLRYELRAPIGGHVHSVDAVVGEFVTPDRPVLEIIDTDRLLVEASVQSSELAGLDLTRTPTFTLLGSTLRGTPPVPAPLADARLVLVDERVDPATGTVPVFYDVANPEGELRIGQRIEVGLEAGPPRTVTAIPTSSLVDQDGQPVAYVQLGGETFEKRHLRLGVRDGGWVEVLEGLEPGERVVTAGGYAIRLSEASGQAPGHGHAH